MSHVPSSTSSGAPTAPFADAGRSKIEYHASIQYVCVRAKVKIALVTSSS
jgi:hypothetical protein